MKIKKLLPLVLLAVAAVLMLSSCDAMLDAIFPTNQMTVDVAVSKNTIPAAAFYADWYNAYYFNNNPSTVALTLTDITAGTSTTRVRSWSGADGIYVNYIFTFLNLKDHVYSLSAYYNSYSNSISYGPVTTIWDGNIPMSAVQLPYKNSSDSTGHLVDLQMYF